MQSNLLSVFLFVLFFQWATAVPARIQKRSFKIERRRNAEFRGHNGPRELLKAYRKYSMPIPQGLLDAMRAEGAASLEAESTQSRVNGAGTASPGAPSCCSLCGGTGSEAASSPGVGIVPATPEKGDIEYLAPVTIGGQTLNLDFDTGSADLWVFNTQLARTAVRGHQLYDPARSKTFQMMPGSSFTIRYGDDSGASGNVGTDTVDIGGVTVEKQAVELATAVSASFVQDMQNNGLLGLAFSSINTVKPQRQKTFFDNVMPSLAEPLFTADLRPAAVGAYEFGRIDSSKFTGDMAWIPVNTTGGFWQFGTSGFAVSGDKVLKNLPTAQAIADTGTTLMLVSQDITNGYYSRVKGAKNDPSMGGITVPCDAALPDLFVDVGGVYVARVRGADIKFARVQGNSECSEMASSCALLLTCGRSLFWGHPDHHGPVADLGRHLLQVAVCRFQRG
jgi:hypothetical protein